VDAWKARLAAFIARDNMFPPLNARIGVAVSGGADSVCLLHILRELYPGLHLTILHINHQLRGHESEADETFVRELARSFDLPIVSERAPIPSAMNIEESARDARRAVFQREIQFGRLHRVALAHTRSDQAETVLFRFLRGAYTTGLAGMRPVTPDGLIRPLLETDRAEVIAYLQDRAIPWREDHTNQDPRFSRNRIRHQLLPELAAAWNPNLPQLLAHHATLAQDDEAYWEAEVDRRALDLLAQSEEAVIIDCSRLQDLPTALVRRLIRRALQLIKGDLRQIDFGHIDAVLELLRSPLGHCRTQAPGVDVMRSFQWVRFAAPLIAPPERDFDIPVQVPALVPLPGAATALFLELIDTQAATPPVRGLMHATLKADLDWSRIPFTVATGGNSRTELLVLRNWRPGDAYQRAGDQREHKLKVLFHEARVPLWERRRWPVLTAAGRIIWTRSFGPASDLAAGAKTQVFLRITEKLRLCESDQALFTSL
jgi:tRNA(Ile)-lysidine synthase